MLKQQSKIKADYEQNYLNQNHEIIFFILIRTFTFQNQDICNHQA